MNDYKGGYGSLVGDPVLLFAQSLYTLRFFHFDATNKLKSVSCLHLHHLAQTNIFSWNVKKELGNLSIENDGLRRRRRRR